MSAGRLEYVIYSSAYNLGAKVGSKECGKTMGEALRLNTLMSGSDVSKHMPHIIRIASVIAEGCASGEHGGVYLPYWDFKNKFCY